MRRSLLPAVAMLGMACAGLGGCARDAEERQLDEMRATIDEVESDRDRAEADMMASAIADTHVASAGERQPAPSLPAPESVQLDDGEGPRASWTRRTPRTPRRGRRSVSSARRA